MCLFIWSQNCSFQQDRKTILWTASIRFRVLSSHCHTSALPITFTIYHDGLSCSLKFICFQFLKINSIAWDLVTRSRFNTTAAYTFFCRCLWAYRVWSLWRIHTSMSRVMLTRWHLHHNRKPVVNTMTIYDVRILMLPFYHFWQNLRLHLKRSSSMSSLPASVKVLLMSSLLKSSFHSCRKDLFCYAELSARLLFRRNSRYAFYKDYDGHSQGSLAGLDLKAP